MKNEHETWRELLDELRNAAGFKGRVDPLRAVLERPGVQELLDDIAEFLLPAEQRATGTEDGLGDPLNVRALLELRDGRVLSRRLSFAMAIAEMLRRLDAGYSAKPWPAPEHVFPRRAPPLAVRTPSASSSAEPATAADANAGSALLLAFRQYFEATNPPNSEQRPTWCEPHASGLASWEAAAAHASSVETAAPAPALQEVTTTQSSEGVVAPTTQASPVAACAGSSARRSTSELKPGEVRASEVMWSDGKRVLPQTLQNWTGRGLQLDGKRKTTKLVPARILPGGQRVFLATDVSRFVEHSERAKREKGPAL